MRTTLTGKLTPHEAAELQDRLEVGFERAYDAASEAGLGRSGYESRFQTATECHHMAMDVAHETLENGMRYPGELTEDFLCRTEDEAQAAEAEQKLDEPGLTPGAPHPDAALAAKGWHVCDHGIYTRHPDGPLQAEPEAC